MPLPRPPLVAALAASWALRLAASQTGNCFVLLPEPLKEEPFPDDAVAMMRQHFLANLNFAGTGAIEASPGDVPALVAMGFPMKAYAYDWMRDGALSMIALQELIGSPVAQVGDHAWITEEVADVIIAAYVQHVDDIVKKDGHTYWTHKVDAHGEPKWELNSALPYTGNWCRPQTDGAGLRATALMLYADRTYFSSTISDDLKQRLWGLIQFDLDWLAQNGTIHMIGCDLWEETAGTSFLWNRLTQRRALLQGHAFALQMGDTARSKMYLDALNNFIGNPITNHNRKVDWEPSWTSRFFNDAVYVTGCPTDVVEEACASKGKDFDGSVILALIHSGWLEVPALPQASLDPATGPSTVPVANTVMAQSLRFCEAYGINREDTAANVPGILYGRYSADQYGGGNPWVLISAALATLFYQAAQEVAHGKHSKLPVSKFQELHSWRSALNAPDFGGTAPEFVAAGDSVLLRIRNHVNASAMASGEVNQWHLYEQITKDQGMQYNAEDLTWSYAEVLNALRERVVAFQLMASAKQYLM